MRGGVAAAPLASGERGRRGSQEVVRSKGKEEQHGVGSKSELHPQTTLGSSCYYCPSGPNPSSSAHLGQCRHLEEGQQVFGAY